MVWVSPKIVTKEEESEWEKVRYLYCFVLLHSTSKESYRIIFQPTIDQTTSKDSDTEQREEESLSEKESRDGEEEEQKDASESKSTTSWDGGTVVAESTHINEIMTDWNYLKEVIIPQVDNLRLEKEDSERVDKFLLQQFQMLYMNEENARIQEIVKRIQRKKKDALQTINGNSFLPTMLHEPGDELLAAFKCSLWTRLVYRKVDFLIFCLRFKFCFTNVENSVVDVPFTSIVSLTKEKTRLVRKDSLKVKIDSGEEYFFSGLNDRDAVYDLLEQLWLISMEKRLKQVSSSDLSKKRSHSLDVKHSHHTTIMPEASKRPASLAFPPKVRSQLSTSLTAGSGDTMVRLEMEKRNEQFHELFNMPMDEDLIGRVEVSLELKSVPVSGFLYISPNFASFLSHSEDSNRRALLADNRGLLTPRNIKNKLNNLVSDNSNPNVKVVIPFSVIEKIDQHKLHLVVEINTKRNRFSVTFFDRKDRNFLLEQWKTSWLGKRNSPGKTGQTDRQKKIEWQDPQKWIAIFGSHFSQQDLRVEEEKSKEWKKYFTEYGSGVDMIFTDEFDKLIMAGLPNHLRSKLWLICSGANYRIILSREKEKQNPLLDKGSTQDKEQHKDNCVSYKEILEKYKGRDSLDTEQIEKDLHRSFNHPYYNGNSENPGEGIDALRRVLTVYSWHNPEIGYCQSMNIICAGLLLFLTEEQSFFLLSTLVEDTLKDYYTKSMVGSCVDQKVFEVMLGNKLPKVYQHINDNLEIPVAWFTLPWFLCLFIGKLPFMCVLRILDCFFHFGVGVLYQVGLALFKILESEILTIEEDDGTVILEKMQSYVATKEGQKELFTTAFIDFESVGLEEVKALRNTYRLQVILNLEEDEKRELIWLQKQEEKRVEQEKLIVDNETIEIELETKDKSKTRDTPLGRGSAPVNLSSSHSLDMSLELEDLSTEDDVPDEVLLSPTKICVRYKLEVPHSNSDPEESGLSKRVVRRSGYRLRVSDIQAMKHSGEFLNSPNQAPIARRKSHKRSKSYACSGRDKRNTRSKKALTITPRTKQLYFGDYLDKAPVNEKENLTGNK